MLNERGPTNSNLRSFLHAITPVVPLRYMPKNSMVDYDNLWQPWGRDVIEYFHLADLWSSYDEWSAYGAGTRIKLNIDESVVQYYVPYLSAIQIFTSTGPVCSHGEETDHDDYKTRDLFSSNGQKENDNEKMSPSDDSSSKDCSLEKERLCRVNTRLGHLYFQYFERSSPYQRVPLLDKINGFTEKFPGLMTLKSVDLSPASWMSVAWYPIYHIPTGKTIKDLSACFLTYHTLSSSFLGAEEDAGVTKKKEKKSGCITLPPFGLATYKMHGNVWLSDQNFRDRNRLGSLMSAADSWLKQLKVQQHDFEFFSSRRYH